MGKVYLLYSDDLAAKSMNAAIMERIRLHQKRMIYIVSSQGLKTLRLEANPTALTDKNIFTLAELERKVRTSVYKRKCYITRADEHYILCRIIEKKYHGTEQYAIFNDIVNELLVLFEFMQWSDVSPLAEALLEKIQHDYSFYEHDIFWLYGEYCSLLYILMAAVQTGEEQTLLTYYGIRSSKMAKKPIDTLSKQLKAEIDRELGKGNAMFFDGFHFFTEFQKYLVESALRQDKDIYFIAKVDLDSYEKAFIYEDIYKPLAAKYGKEIQTIKLDAEPFEDKTALDYIRRTYPNVYITPLQEEQARVNDSSIEMIAPFVSWENEFAFVAQRISDYLRSLRTTDKAVLKAALLNDIAVLTPANWQRYTYMMKSVLKNVGLFVLREDAELLLADINPSSIQEVYFSKQEFLAAKIMHLDDTALNAQEKLILFEKGFTGLSIKASPRPISAYPVGQYIRQLYSFVVDGMDTYKFKLVLYSNWFYHTRRSDQKWDQYISDFDLIEHYFSDKSTIEEWIAEFERLWEVKSGIHNDPLYLYHPLAAVPNESLVFLRDITVILCGIMQCIDFTGSIEEHVACLVHDVIDAFSIIDEDHAQLQMEQVIVCRLYEAAEALSGSSLIGEIDTAYFAQNLLHMLEDYEQDQNDNECGQYAFNIISMENAKKYKVIFFVMAERGKNPRVYRETFPYSKDILAILTDPQYGINCKPAQLHGLDYHVLLNRHGFQNFLDFTTEKLIITQSKRSSEGENAPSVYCHDIATAFGCDLPELYIYPDAQHKKAPVVVRQYKIRLPKKSCYSVTELAMFKLCSKLYLHSRRSEPFVYRDAFQLKLYFQNIVFVDLLRQFAESSTIQNKLYSVYDDEALRTLLDLLPAVIEKHLPLFSFIKSHELSDAKKFLCNMLVNFVCYEITNRNASGYYFVQRAGAASRPCQGYHLLLDYDIVIQHGERYNEKTQKAYPNVGTYQSTMLIDFLVLHSTKETGEFLRHYKDMIYALNSNDRWQDRVKLASRIVTKLNNQFYNERFAKDGMVRTDHLVSELENTNFLAVRLPAGPYCRYCKIRDICKSFCMNGGDRYAN